MNSASATLSAWPRPWLTMLILGLAVTLGLTIGFGQGLGLGTLLGLALVMVLWLRPEWTYFVAIGSVTLGQLVRLPLPGTDTGLLINDLLLPALIVTWVLKRLGTGRWYLPRTALWVPMMLWGIAMGLSVVVNAGRYDGRELFGGTLYIIRWIEYAALFFITTDFVRRQSSAWRVVVALVWTGVALSLLGFLQLRIFPDFSFMAPQGWDPHIGRLLSTWFDPNFLAGYLAALISLTLSVALIRGRRGLWWWMATAVMTLAIVLTYSRSGYVALAIGVGLVTMIRSRALLYLGLLGLVTTILFVPRVQERVIGIRSIDETAQLRIVSWQNALGIIGDHPVFGVGYNLYREAQLQAGILKDPTIHSATGSDSSLLLVMATTGVVGLIAYVWLLLALAREAWRTAFLKELSPEWRAVGLGTVASFAALLVHSQFVNGLLYPHLMQFIWMMAAVVVMVRPENQQT